MAELELARWLIKIHELYLTHITSSALHRGEYLGVRWGQFLEQRVKLTYFTRCLINTLPKS